MRKQTARAEAGSLEVGGHPAYSVRTTFLLRHWFSAVMVQKWTPQGPFALFCPRRGTSLLSQLMSGAIVSPKPSDMTDKAGHQPAAGHRT